MLERVRLVGQRGRFGVLKGVDRHMVLGRKVVGGSWRERSRYFLLII